MHYRVDEHTSRRTIAVAVGILVGWRDCLQSEAFVAWGNLIERGLLAPTATY